jgi:hypothetical protein
MRAGIHVSAAAAVLLLLAGCASSGSRPAASTRVGDTARQPTLSFPRPNNQRSDAITGRNAASLITLFGQPALDVHEGRARKLQFADGECVLDAYLYPQRERGEPVVTHVDTRLPDGRDTDRDDCIAALRQR